MLREALGLWRGQAFELGRFPPIRVMTERRRRGVLRPEPRRGGLVRCDSGGGALMEEWVVAGLLGVVAGYGVRVWQEKTPAVVKRPAEAVVRTIGSAWVPERAWAAGRP